MQGKQLISLLLLVVCFMASPVDAAVSEKCKNDTKIIQSFGSLQEDLHLSLHNHVHGHAVDCNYSSFSEFVCNVQFEGQNKTLQEYSELCDRVEGKVIERTIDISHMLLGVFSFNVTFLGIPQCVGTSCDEALLEKHELWNNVFGKLHSMLKFLSCPKITMVCLTTAAVPSPDLRRLCPGNGSRRHLQGGGRCMGRARFLEQLRRRSGFLGRNRSERVLQ